MSEFENDNTLFKELEVRLLGVPAPSGIFDEYFARVTVYSDMDWYNIPILNWYS